MNYIIQEFNNMLATINTLMNAAGSYRKDLQQSLFYGFLAPLFFGLALITFYPMSKSWLIENGRIHINFAQAMVWAVVFLFLVVLGSIFNWLAQGYESKGKAVKASYETRMKLGDRLRQIPQEKLTQKQAGELSSVLLANVEEAILFTSFIFRLVLTSLVIPVVVIIATLIFDSRAGLLMSLILPVSFGLYIWRRPAFQRGFGYLSGQSNKMKGELVQFIQGIAVIKACNVTDAQLNQYEMMCEKVNKIQYIGQTKGQKPNFIITSVVYIGLFLVIVGGTFWVTNGSMLTTALAAIVVVFSRLGDSFAVLVLYAAALEIFSTGQKNIQEVMNIPVLAVKDKLSQEPKDYTIEFEHVNFHYENSDQLVLKDISLRFEQKSMTAIVGGSGCGKTTMIRLLTRFLEVTSGCIKIGGVDIRDMPTDYLMSLVTVVFQDVYLFNDSIYNNIKLGKLTASDEEIYQAAKLAQCHDFIMQLPATYQTQVGDIGARLSGGEKQRISIARALLKDTPIIVLDEPTAALDTENEVAVQKALNALIQDKTIIVISHRLSTTTGANNIIVLEDGMLRQQGRHQQLLQEGGKYQFFWDLQQAVHQIRVKVS